MIRSIVWLSFTLIGLSHVSCNSQPSSPFAPESGTYTGSTLRVTGNLSYTYNPVTGFGFQPGTSITPGVNVVGDLILNNKGGNNGTYSFTKWKEASGTWRYDRDEDKLSFTGELKTAVLSYHAGKGLYTLTLALRSDKHKEGTTYYFSKKASKPFPRPAHPNPNVAGLFTVKPDLQTVAFLDPSTGKVTTSFSGKTAATNNNHYTLSIGFTDNTRYYQISLTDPAGKSKQWTSQEIMNYNWKFFNYQFGILNGDQSRMALLGQTPDSYLDLTYTPGEYAIGIFDMKGTTLGILPVESNRYIIPAFLPDGRLVYCPKEGGIAITDQRYQRSKTIYREQVNAIAASPDGKTLAFCEGVHFFTIDTDGGNKRPVICDGEPLTADKADNVITMTFSPDGKQIGVSYKTGSNYSILIVPLDGGSYRFLRDDEGEQFHHAGQLMSWH